MPSQTYDILNKGWKSTCRVLLGGEVGELKDYDEWLRRYLPKPAKRKSHLSGKEVILAMNGYAKDAMFISGEEQRPLSIQTLTINEVKDIDSILDAVREKWEYTGNRILGNSAFVESSDIVMDSTYVQDSTNITESSYVYLASMVRRNSKYVFGGGWFGQCEFAINMSGAYNDRRCLESFLVGESSDIFFSYYCYGCNDIMFSFHMRGKRHCIGNLQLPKEEYLPLKKKLLAELREELVKNKSLPSIFELVGNREPEAGISPKHAQKFEKEDMGVIEKAFSSTYKVMLRTEPRSIKEYESWLTNRTSTIKEIKSVFGGVTYAPQSGFYPFTFIPEKRVVSLEEAMSLSELSLKKGELQNLERLRRSIPKIGFFSPMLIEGAGMNIMKSNVSNMSSHVYKVCDATNSEYAALSDLVLNSKYAFGCFRVLESQFCMKCYNSLKLSRCFELDSCTACADSYFCHNSEALSDCMFCFNAKGKRHAIGNTELELAKYKSIKDSVLEQIATELEKKKSLRYDIFSIGSSSQ